MFRSGLKADRQVSSTSTVLELQSDAEMRWQSEQQE